MQVLGPHLLSLHLSKWVLKNCIFAKFSQLLSCTLRLFRKTLYPVVQPFYYTDSIVQDSDEICNFFSVIDNLRPELALGGPCTEAHPVFSPCHPRFSVIAGQGPHWELLNCSTGPQLTNHTCLFCDTQWEGQPNPEASCLP